MIGQHLAHYIIEAKLGEGGMGVVYRARDTKLNRLVALKLLPPALAKSPEELERFKLEARAAAALNHNHIATVYEINEVDDRPFIAMELVDGQTLGQRMAAGPLQADEAIRIAREIALGLEEAHEHGVVHRDIKPANIMLTARGQVKIMDFGLAKMAHAPGLTKAGSTLGTPSYMSPEQAQAGSVDGRTDIWSLGVILYEMLSGQRPFGGEHESAVVYAIVHEEPKPLATLRSGLSAELIAVVESALAKSPEKRFHRARDMEKALGESFSAEKSGPSAPPYPVKRRAFTPWLYTAAAVIVGVFALSRFAPSLSRGAAIESLAVMPLTYAAQDSTSEYLADGIAETIISSLSKRPDLRVMSWYAVRRMKGKDLTPDEIAERLDVHAVMMGTLKPVGDRLRLSVELINARDQSQIWGEQYEHPLAALLELQDQITAEVYRQLRSDAGSVEPTRLADYTTRNSDAYAHYLKGRYFWNRFTPEDNQQSIQQFQQALDADPTFALAYAGLSDAWWAQAEMTESDDEAVANARAYAQSALELDSNLADAHYSMATINYFFDWDWEGADAELKRAAALNPNHAFTYELMAARLADAGRTEESIEQMRLALKLDPLSHRLNCGYGGMLLGAGKYPEAVEQAKRTLQLEYTCPFEHRVQGLGYVGMGEYEEGFAQLDTALAKTHHAPSYQVAVIHAYMLKGDTETARYLFDSLLTSLPPEMRDQRPYELAELYAAMGEDDEALEWLEKAYEARSSNMPGIKTDPVFERIRSQPGFQAIVQKMRLQS